MKSVSLLVVVLVLLAAAPWRSYAAVDEAGVASTGEAQQKKQYEKSMEERLKKLGKELDGLAAKAAAKTATMSREAKTDIDRGIAEAKTKQKDASAKLEQMKKQSVKTWKKFTSETDAAMDEFEKAFERAKADFKK